MFNLGYLLLAKQVRAYSQATCLTYYFPMYSKIMTKVTSIMNFYNKWIVHVMNKLQIIFYII